MRAVDQGGQGRDQFWTRLSCRSFAANAVRLQLHALAYNLGNFLRTLATPEPIKDWSLTSLKETDQDRREGRQPRALCCVSDGRGRNPTKPIRRHLAVDRRIAAAGRIDSVERSSVVRSLKLTGEVRLEDGKFGASCRSGVSAPSTSSELCGKVGDGVNQAADLISATASIPSLNCIPLTTFGNWF